jgi:hypothetical protein
VLGEANIPQPNLRFELLDAPTVMQFLALAWALTVDATWTCVPPPAPELPAEKRMVREGLRLAKSSIESLIWRM